MKLVQLSGLVHGLVRSGWHYGYTCQLEYFADISRILLSYEPCFDLCGGY